MSPILQFIVPALGGGSGVSAFGVAVARFVKNQAEGVVREATEPLAEDIAVVKEDVAYIKGSLGLGK